jgi:hypothetical protein
MLFFAVNYFNRLINFVTSFTQRLPYYVCILVSYSAESTIYDYLSGNVLFSGKIVMKFHKIMHTQHTHIVH